MAITFSPQQLAVFDWVERGKGSAFVEAVAGAGKTTTIIEACKRMRGSIAFAAYNKKIALEIEAKTIAQGIQGVSVGTFHKFGYAAWRKVAPRAKLDPRAKQDAILEQLQVPADLQDFVNRLVSLAKNAAIGLLAAAEDDSAWWAIVTHHDLEEALEDPRDAKLGVHFAKQALALSRDLSHELIDFDDMIFMPVVTSCRVWQNDWLLVDEAQDINPARRALARKMLRPRGRAVFVGDRHQAIYGFTGADAVDRIGRDFACKMIPLTTTYRCPQSVVAAARKYVDHIEAHASAPEGLVCTAHQDDLTTFGLTAADAILCRLTAPLVKQAFTLIKAGIGCHVEGRDIGAGLLKLAQRWQRVKTIDALRDRLEEYAAREVEKLTAKGQETKAEAVQDRVDTLLALKDGCRSLDDLEAKITGLFSNSEDGHQNTLTLSTVHKAKGREWDRVFVLGFEKYMPSRWARQDWQREQENNLIYVAFTRAKRDLLLVSVEPRAAADAKPAETKEAANAAA